MSNLRSQYSGPIITSVPTYIVLKTCSLLLGDVKQRGSVIEQTPVAVFLSHPYLSSCLYCCEDMCTIVGGVKPRGRLIERSSVTVISDTFTSVHAYIVLTTCVLLKRNVKPRGNLIEQTAITVWWSHLYLSSCLYCCEDVFSIAR